MAQLDLAGQELEKINEIVRGLTCERKEILELSPCSRQFSGFVFALSKIFLCVLTFPLWSGFDCL